MNKSKSCFIIFFYNIFSCAIFIVLFIQKTTKTQTGSTITNTDGNSNNSQSLDAEKGSALNLSINNIHKDNSDDYLFLGIDERENQYKFQGRTDTIILYHAGVNGVDALISIPRDTKVELEGRGTNKINAAFEFGGPDMISDEIYKLTDIGVDKIMIVNFAGFIKNNRCSGWCKHYNHGTFS